MFHSSTAHKKKLTKVSQSVLSLDASNTLPRVTPRRPPLAAPTLWCELGSQIRHLGLQIVHALRQRHPTGPTRLQQRRERAHLPHMDGRVRVE